MDGILKKLMLCVHRCQFETHILIRNFTKPSKFSILIFQIWSVSFASKFQSTEVWPMQMQNSRFFNVFQVFKMGMFCFFGSFQWNLRGQCFDIFAIWVITAQTPDSVELIVRIPMNQPAASWMWLQSCSEMRQNLRPWSLGLRIPSSMNHGYPKLAAVAQMGNCNKIRYEKGGCLLHPWLGTGRQNLTSDWHLCRWFVLSPSPIFMCFTNRTA